MNLWGRVKAVFTGYPEATQEPSAGEFNHVWVEIDRSRPHMGLANFSYEKDCPFPQGVKIKGVSIDYARVHLVGKIMNWGRFDFDFETMETDMESFRKMVW